MAEEKDDPQWIDQRLSGDKMYTPKEEETKTSFAVVIGWAHIGTTLTLAIFLWGQYESSQKERELMRTQITINTQRINDLLDRVGRVDHDLAEAIKDRNGRIDAVRDDVKSLQQQLMNHYSVDDRRFGDYQRRVK